LQAKIPVITTDSITTKNRWRTKPKPNLFDTKISCSSSDNAGHCHSLVNGTNTQALHHTTRVPEICDDESQYIALDCEFVGVGPRMLSALGMFILPTIDFMVCVCLHV